MNINRRSSIKATNSYLNKSCKCLRLKQSFIGNPNLSSTLGVTLVFCFIGRRFPWLIPSLLLFYRVWWDGVGRWAEFSTIACHAKREIVYSPIGKWICVSEHIAISYVFQKKCFLRTIRAGGTCWRLPGELARLITVDFPLSHWVRTLLLKPN